MTNSAGARLIYDSFARKLSEVKKKELLFNISKNLLLTFIFLIALGFILVLSESVFRFGPAVRTILYWGFLSVSVTTVIYFSINYLLHRTGIIGSIDIIKYSRKVGDYFDDIRDKLSNSLSLVSSGSTGESGNTFSEELIFEDIKSIESIAGKKDLSSFINFSSLKKLLLILLSLIVFISAAFLVFPKTLTGSVKRIINHNFSFLDNDMGIKFDVIPGDVEISAGENVIVGVNINSTSGDLKIREIDLFTKQITKDGFEIVPDPVKLTSATENNFTGTIENPMNDLFYYVEYKGIRSDEYKITVSEYPVIKNFKIKVFPPEFTGMPVKTLPENEGNIFCPEGSRIEFELNSNMDLSYAGIEFNAEQKPFETEGSKASGSVTFNESGSYRFILKDRNGGVNRNFKLYTVKVIVNEPPKITIIEPSESNYELKGESDLIIRSRISDDYGFSKLVLGYRKVKLLTGKGSAPEFSYLDIEIKNPKATSLEVPYVWNISSLNLKSGESVEYFTEVTDNTGKSSRSEIKTIQYKALTEVLKESQTMTKELKSEMQNSFDQMEELKKNIEDIKKQFQKNEELGLNEESKKQLENKLDNFQKSLNSSQSKLDENMNELQKNNMLGEKTLEQYMELQKMFNKINTPELQRMLEKLREALKKNNSEELKDALKNFKFDEEAFKKYMEKAMELMKKIENMQKFGELTQKLDDIRKQQEELKKETENSQNSDMNKMNELSQKQQDIKDQTKDFNSELQKLIDEMNKMKDQLSPEDLENIQKQMNKKGVENKMQKSSDELQKSQKSSSEKTQEEIMDDLNSMNEDMKKALSDMMDSQDMNNKLMDKLKEIQKKLEEMSKRQQELKDKTDELEKEDKDEFESNEKEQKQLQGDLSESIDDLMNASKMGMDMSPDLGKELGNAYNKMDKAGKELGEKNKGPASSNQGKAKESLDNASKMLGDMISKMGKDGKSGKNGKGNKPGSGNMGELMGRLGEIIAQQMGMNGKTGKMGMNGQDGENGKTGKDGRGNSPDGLTPEQRQEMQRLSLEQQQIQKSLEMLNEELKREQERSGEKVLGNLDEVQKEMQEIVKELSEYNVDDKLIEKQNRILSRMLDARLSQREKDFEPKRESRPGENINRLSPPEIVLSGPNSYNALKEDFLRLNKEGYSEDYESLISRYLMELKKNGIK
ncbi:MAG: hypothetical protein JSS91_00465 [Bacteroidetes bacterium]|nr:hypothetical protein [Bacteroidota bacterium]